MKPYWILCAGSLFLLTGCASVKNDKTGVSPRTLKVQPVEAPVVVPPPPAEQLLLDNNSNELTGMKECSNELNALRVYNQQSYVSFQNEFKKLGAQTEKYLRIKDGISPEINALAMPRHEFQVRELCFRIKTRLSQLLISQSEK